METVEMKQVEGGVCAARGFSANGLNCGLNQIGRASCRERV